MCKFRTQINSNLYFGVPYPIPIYFVKTTFLLTKSLSKYLIWRNMFSVRVNFSFFHTRNNWTVLQCLWLSWIQNIENIKWVYDTYSLNTLNISFAVFTEKIGSLYMCMHALHRLYQFLLLVRVFNHLNADPFAWI